jgi:putative transcriptional regulator
MIIFRLLAALLMALFSFLFLSLFFYARKFHVFRSLHILSVYKNPLRNKKFGEYRNCPDILTDLKYLFVFPKTTQLNKGIKQEELAEALGVSRQTTGSLENGRYNPSIILAFKIAGYFNITIEEVFIYEEENDDKN